MKIKVNEENYKIINVCKMDKFIYKQQNDRSIINLNNTTNKHQ